MALIHLFFEPQRDVQARWLLQVCFISWSGVLQTKLMTRVMRETEVGRPVRSWPLGHIFANLALPTLNRQSNSSPSPHTTRHRCQEVINACTALGANNPIESIHDVGAGGLSNAVPEIVHDCDRGARLELRKVLSTDASMSPMAIWCNEAQERCAAPPPPHVRGCVLGFSTD